MARGIAAVVDAIFLILIAVVASSIILSAANHYGRYFDIHSQKILMNYYAKQVVRTIVTASIERDPGVPDYLLSYLKESVENFKDLGPAEEKLKEVVKKAMRPVEDRFDYAVVLDGRGTEWDTVYVLYKITTEDGKVIEGSKRYKGAHIELFEEWIDSIGTVYTSATTIFLRFCPTKASCLYIPVDIRVMIFPLGEANEPL